MYQPVAAASWLSSSTTSRSVHRLPLVAHTSPSRICANYGCNMIINDKFSTVVQLWKDLRGSQARQRHSSSRGLPAAVPVANEEQHEANWEALVNEPGPAFKATLRMLEWGRLCEHLSRHASTALGKRMCQQLEVPVDTQSSVRMLQETRAILAMENEYLSLLDYGGISTTEAESAIKRASKGGMVAAKQLRGVVTMLAGADRLKRQVQLVARQNNATNKNSPLWPLLEAVAAVRVPGALMRDINSAINEEGELADSSSEQVRTTRSKVRAITGRINNILKGFPGEASEKGGRLCIAAPAGTKISSSVLLGTSLGGGMVYIEPPHVVALNNELAAARAEAMAAEESVMWELSGRLMGCLEDVETAFNVVGWLDILSAKVRFGMWMGAVLPKLTPWEDVFHTRSGTALRKQQPGGVGGSSSSSSGSTTEAQQQQRQLHADSSSRTNRSTRHQQQQQQQQEAINWDAMAVASAAAVSAVHLRKFSHPLLLADYLEQRQQLEREARLYSGTTATSSSSSSSGGGNKQISSRLLGTRKEVVYKDLGLDGDPDSSSSDSSSSGLTPKDKLAALKPPRPIDLVIQPETSVVVITGPNTGGKTATMKAFGLAVCMAKAGLLIPAQAPARLPCYSSVLADIGDEQSLTANLSTFSGHIKRISAVRAEADGRSLLLLDELGTGTDPTEGAALGLALLKQLIKGGIGNGALTIATTHHSIMTSLKFEDARAENASVEFDEEKLGPTYKLLWGVPGRSNALNIASRLGLDPAIIAAARGRLTAGVTATNRAIEELEQVQEEVRHADLAVFAVQADLEQKRRRLAAISELAKADQVQIAKRRTAAVLQVSAAARALLKALKLERKAWRQSKAPGKISMQLDVALAENNSSAAGLAAVAANSLDSALETFRALEQSCSDVTAYDVLQQQRQQRLEQQMQQQEDWVQDWAQLLARARATLAASIAAVSSTSSSGRPVPSGGSSSSSYEDDDDIEAQIMALYATKEAKEQAQRAAAQQVVDGLSKQLMDSSADAASAAGIGQGTKNTKQTLDELVTQELFAAGVTAVEDALEHDQQLTAVLQAKQAAAEAATAEQAAQQARQQVQQAQLVSAFEQELDQWEIDLAFFAPDQVVQEEQQLQQSDESAAAAAASSSAAKREEELEMVQALEDMLDLDDDWAPRTSSTSSEGDSSSSSSNRYSSPQQQQQQQQQQQSGSSPTTSKAARAGVDAIAAAAAPAAADVGIPSSFDNLLDFLELDDSIPGLNQAGGHQQQQQQPLRTQQQQQQRAKGKMKGKPLMKFKL